VKPVATIVGSNGQDGQLLKKKLKSIGYSIVGITSDTMDITNSKEVSDLIPSAKPKEVYSRAAFHHSSEEDINKDLKLFSKSFDIHVIATVNFLDEITFAYQSVKVESVLLSVTVCTASRWNAVWFSMSIAASPAISSPHFAFPAQPDQK